MLEFFNKPYPFNDDLKHNAKIVFFISVGVFAFLFFFEPLEIALLATREKYYLIVGLSFITFASLSLHLLLLPSFFPKSFASSVWNIKKEILWNLWILSTVLICFFFYTKLLGVMKFDFEDVVKLIFVAIFPISILIIVNHNKILRNNLKIADEVNKKLKDHKSVQEKIVYFNSDYQKDSLAVKANLLIFIRSANNYIEVFWKEGESIKNQMVRCSMIKAEELLKEFRFMLKCHRSYMINVNYIDRMEGNSQGYKIFFQNISFPIPVSKNMVVKLQELL
jgi:hypothetical protein